MNNKLGNNNSSSLFGGNGLNNSSAVAGGVKQIGQGSSSAMISQLGMPNFSPLKQNSEAAFNVNTGKPMIQSAISGQNIQTQPATTDSDNLNVYGSHHQLIFNPGQQYAQQSLHNGGGGAQSHRGFYQNGSNLEVVNIASATQQQQNANNAFYLQHPVAQNPSIFNVVHSRAGNAASPAVLVSEPTGGVTSKASSSVKDYSAQNLSKNSLNHSQEQQQYQSPNFNQRKN